MLLLLAGEPSAVDHHQTNGGHDARMVMGGLLLPPMPLRPWPGQSKEVPTIVGGA